MESALLSEIIKDLTRVKEIYGDVVVYLEDQNGGLQPYNGADVILFGEDGDWFLDEYKHLHMESDSHHPNLPACVVIRKDHD